MRYADLAPKLFDAGWRNLLPLTGCWRISANKRTWDTKGTRVKWKAMQHNLMTEASLNYLIDKYGDAPGIGIVFGECHGIVGVDIDIEDEPSLNEVLKVAEEELPPTDYIRIGKPPKRLMLYRGNVKSVKPHPIEIFGSSCQTVAFGPHPSGRQYVWPFASIEECGPDDLPEVTQQQIDVFLSRCKRETTPRTVDGRPIQWADWEKYRTERRMYGIDAAAKQIKEMVVGRRRNVVLSVSGWLFSQGYDKKEIAAFVDMWFPDHIRTEDWQDPSAQVAAMFETATEKWGDKDWELKDD